MSHIWIEPTLTKILIAIGLFAIGWLAWGIRDWLRDIKEDGRYGDK